MTRLRASVLAAATAFAACTESSGGGGALVNAGVDVLDTTVADDIEVEDVLPPNDVEGEDAAEDIWNDVGDDKGDVEDAVDTADVVDVPPVEPDYVTCDAGDEAWAQMVLPALLGRRVAGLREARVIADMASATSRALVVRGLMDLPEFESRWEAFILDELRVNRVGDKVHSDCYGDAITVGDTGQVAAFVRDNDASSTYTSPFNMTDLVRSSLKLDDVSPIYRAHLFAMMARPITGANVDALQMDITRRQDFGEIFEATYLHRNVVCAGCHNSQFSTTDAPDPTKDRHWPLPGLFEKALYGQNAGRPEMEFYANFRHLDVVRDSGGKRPWRLHSSCGRFTPAEQIPADPAGFAGFFISDHGATSSIWNVEAALADGFGQLRADGKLVVDEATLDVDPEAAFAYLVSVRFVNQVWRELMGYPLTLVHYFPRNEAQRDLLGELTQRFVASGFSLRTLVMEIVTSPYFAEPAPESGCGSQDHPYTMPALFNPWILLEDDPILLGNSVGDAVHRYDARVLLSMASAALIWPEAPAYPGEGDESFQKAIGVFVKDAEPGFDGVDFQGLLTWESRYAACSLTAAGPTGSCADACGGQSPAGCYCDDECTANGDCCADYSPVCLGGAPPGPADEGVEDWFDRLEAAVALAEAAGESVTLGDIAAAVKDRIVGAPELSAEEGGLIASLFGAADLQVSADAAPTWPDSARRFCGVLVSTPDFLLGGLPPPGSSLPPQLVVGATSYEAHCETLRRAVFDPQLWKVTCGEDALTVAPFAPPLGGSP